MELADMQRPSDSNRRTLMIVPFSLNPIRVRPVKVLEQLVQYSKVDVICLNDGNPTQLNCKVEHLTVIPNGSKTARAFRILVGLLHGIPINAEFYNSMRLPGKLASIDLSQYDAIYVHRLPLHRLNLKHKNIIYDAEDCWSNRCRVLAAHLSDYRRILYALDSKLTPRHEVAACNSARIVLTTAEREAAHLRRIGVTKPIEVYTHDRQCETLPRTLQQRERFVISFHGKMSYAPNAKALRILNDDIAPRLDSKQYDLRIIGKCPEAYRTKFPNLCFTGYVESIPDAIRDADLSIFPLPISVGFSNKAMESLAAFPFLLFCFCWKSCWSMAAFRLSMPFTFI